MSEFFKNFVPCLAITLAVFGGGIAFIFLILALIPPEFGTATAKEVAVGAGGWKALLHSIPLIMLISILTASWVSAMKPFTSPRKAVNEAGDIVFLDPMIK